MPYGWKIKLNDVDISDKVSRFSISCSLDSFCREMSLDIADKELYDSLDFSQISESPEIEILTKIADTWVSQGKFFIERPALASTVKSDLMQGVWGRSLPAMLDEPFAPKVTKIWDKQTTFFGICQEMCDLAGFTWNPAYADISDFVIYPYTFEVEGLYPIGVIVGLATLAGALVTTDRSGHLCVKQIDYDPSAADVTITDVDISEITENPEWPAFGNRVRITPTGSLVSGYSIRLSIPDPCLQADGKSQAKLIARVTDEDGEPVNGLVVDWEIDAENATLNSATSNTQEIIIHNESQRAADFYSVVLDFPPSSVDGVYAYADKARQNNFASGGYEINGNTITLKDKLDYCDQLLLITYRVGGVAINYLTAGDEAGDVTVRADVEGQDDEGTVYIDNPCECPPSIRLTAAPGYINPGGTASLLVYAEESGPVTTGRMVFVAEVSATKRGTLSWTWARLSRVDIVNEETVAINEVSGVSQCEVSMFPASFSGIYRADENGEPMGGNLFASRNGKIVDLNTIVETGTQLLAYYKAQGAALNHFTGAALGTALIKAWLLTNREEGSEATANIKIVDNTAETDDYPDDWTQGEGDGGYGGYGGDDGDYDPTEEEEEPENWCVPESVSHNPSDSALAGRFDTALEHDCTCQEICAEEFNIYETTQGYDSASGRKISEIVIEDYELEEGSPEYWEKYAELKTEAIIQCEDQCEASDFQWDEENPEIIEPEDEAVVSVIGGAPPFQWEVSGTGYSLAAEETEDRENVLIADETACGAAKITVTDLLGSEVIGYVRGPGHWKLVEECSPEGWDGDYTAEAIVGNFKYVDDWCGAPCEIWCSSTCPAHTECPIEPPSLCCWVESSKKYEWVCDE